MVYWELTFLILAMVTAFFAFSEVAAGAAEPAQVLFGIFVALFLLRMAASTLRGQRDL